MFQYQSAEYDVIRFDELTHFTEFQYLYLMSRVRGANRYPKQIKSSTNPGGVGHGWVKRLFIDRDYRKSERPEDYLRLCDLSPRKAGEMLDRVRKTISPQAVFYGKTDRWISRAAVSCGEATIAAIAFGRERADSVRPKTICASRAATVAESRYLALNLLKITIIFRTFADKSAKPIGRSLAGIPIPIFNRQI